MIFQTLTLISPKFNLVCLQAYSWMENYGRCGSFATMILATLIISPVLWLLSSSITLSVTHSDKASYPVLFKGVRVIALDLLNQIQDMKCLLSIIHSNLSTLNKKWLWEARKDPHTSYIHCATCRHCTIQYLTHTRDHSSFCCWSISLSGHWPVWLRNTTGVTVKR